MRGFLSYCAVAAIVCLSVSRADAEDRKSWGNDADFTNGCAKTAGPSPCAFASTTGKDTTGRELGGY